MSGKKLIRIALITVVFLTACDFGLLDNQGVEEIVSEKNELKSNEPVDDNPEDKTLVYDKDRTVVEYFDNCAVTLNKSKTLTKLDIMDMNKTDPDLVEKIYPTRVEAMKALNGRLNDKNVSFIPSIETVNGKLKKLNDGLYAGIELALEKGVSEFPSKPEFLSKVAVKLNELGENAGDSATAHVDSAKVYIAVAMKLSDIEEIPFNSSILEKADSEISDLKDMFYIQPTGFYTWSDELKMIFERDRFLQNYQDDEDPYSVKTVGKSVALTLAITSDEALEKEYDQILGIYSDLTNPAADIPVTALKPYIKGLGSLNSVDSIINNFLSDNKPEYTAPSCNNHFALIPASYSKETDYFQSLTCDTEYAGINFMDELIAAIKNGKIDLEPDGSSGWYDYQSYALETLLLPERGEENNNLLLTKAYKEKLIESFKSIMIQNRETHVKSLEMGAAEYASAEPKPFDIYPKLPAEPFSTFYLRNARAYRFLQTALTAITGNDFMESVKVNSEGNETKTSLKDGLEKMQRLLYGLSFITADSVGAEMTLMKDELSKEDVEDCRAEAQCWLAAWREDSDIKLDPRVAVPMQYDYDRNTLTYWGVIGVRIIRATTEFHKDFLPEIVGVGGHDDDSWNCQFREFLPHDYYLLIEKSAEFTVDLNKPILDREAFRAICDKGTTEKDILAELEKY
ncbi:MAG TPA: hypothetical protein P5044_02220 [bacterium]|nr:hypothetical protein [bacterium]